MMREHDLLRADGEIPRPPRRTTPETIAEDGRPRIRVQSLGAARILVGEQIISAQSEVVFAILLRLVHTPGMSIPRDILLSELWPDQMTTRQRGNLRQALYKLRGMQVDIALRGETVQLAREQVLRTFSIERDLERFDRDITRGDEPFGIFLPGFVSCSPVFGQWIEQTRETVHGDVRRVLVEILRQRRERADWGATEVLSRWLLQFDPLNEDATLALAECTMLAGGKMEAVAMLDRYLAELGPYAGDIRLPAQLLRKRFTEPPARRRPSLAVTERHFVGREQELAELTMSMRRARWHDGSAVLLHGPAGIGKTRLVTELAKVAQIEGYREICIECRETDLQRPLSVFLEALPELLSSPGALGCSPESMAVLKRLVGERDGELTITPSTECSSTDDLRQSNGTLRLEETLRNVRTQSIRHAIVDIVGAVSEERPLLISIEDSHWMDSDSWDGIADLIQRILSMRVFLVITSRSRQILAQRPNRIPANLGIRAIPALSSLASLKLARAIGEDYAATMDAGTERWIIDACEGSPLALRALVNHWIETGDAGGIPPTLQALLEHRIDRLHPHALRAMQTVCVLGKLASVDRVGRVLELPTHELINALEQLQEAGCLSRAQAAMVVTHELIGRAATERLQGLAKATIHLAIARSLEEEFRSSPEAPLIIDALYHYASAGSEERCASLAIAHTRDLIQAGRPKALLTLLESLDISLADAELRDHVEKLCARLRLDVGEYGRALLHAPGGYIVPSNLESLAEPAVDELLSTLDSAYRADVLADRDELARICGTLVGLQHLAPSTRTRAAEIGLTIAANTCDNSIASMCYAAVKSNMNLEELADEQFQRLSLLYHTIFGDLFAAERTARDMIRRLSRHEASSHAAQDIGRAAYALRICGKLPEAEEALRLSFTMALSVDAPKLALYPAWQLSQMQLDTGNDSELGYWTGQLRSLVRSNDDPISTNFLTAHYCHMAIEAGMYHDANTFLHEVRSSLPRIPTTKASAYVVALELGVSLLDLSWEPSEALIAAAMEKHRRTASFGTSDYLTSTIAATLVRKKEYRRACDFIEEYSNRLRRELGPLSVALQRAREEARAQCSD